MIWTTRQRSEGPGHLTYLRQGSGTPLVLIHGVGLRAEAWAAMMPLLAERYTVYALDMPGHGDSPLNGAQTLDDFVVRVVEFITSLDGPVAIAGHSMGAMIALRIAERHAELITAFAALNPIYKRSDAAAKAVQSRAAALEVTNQPDPTATLQRWFGAAPQGEQELARDACGDWLRVVDRLGYQSAYRVFAQEDGPSETALSNFSMPALFMTGQHDANSTGEMSKKMAGIAPGGTAIVVQDAAHMMPMTHPNTVAEAMLETFREDTP